MGNIFCSRLQNTDRVPPAAVATLVEWNWSRCNTSTTVCLITKGGEKTSIPLPYVEELLKEYPFFAVQTSKSVYDAQQHHFGDVVFLVRKLHHVKTGREIIPGAESYLFSDLFKSGGLHLFNSTESALDKNKEYARAFAFPQPTHTLSTI